MVGRMEEHRSFFYAQNSIAKAEREDRLTTKKLNGGGSRAHKDYTGMHRMQAAQLQYDKG